MHSPLDTDTTPQGGLDALVTQLAGEFMAATAATLQDTLERALQIMATFFDVDTSYLRRNDFDRGLSVLVTEWPHRQDVPDPDPLAEVRFDADPVFAAIRNLAEPFVLQPELQAGSYQQRVEEASGVGQVSMAMVPLINEAATTGVLGFVKFGDRSWHVAETNALQAVASLIVQLQGRVAAEAKVQFHAYHDELTGLPNRRALLDELHRRVDVAPHPTGLLFVDVDRFKVLNDSLGHGAGDRLLVAIAERMRLAVRPGDFVARLAGDEFVVLLDDISGEVMTSIAGRLVDVLGEPIDIADHQITRTVSIGSAIAAAGAEHREELLAHADVALRQAKERGGNCTVAFDGALRDIGRERSSNEILLRKAINSGGLVLHYQPEVDLRTGELLAVEALVRWNHPDRGLLTAAAFIDAAEESGLIVDLGSWVMTEACRQMAAWRNRWPNRRFMMRINMSPAQLATRNFVELVADRLRDNDLPGRLLCFEITEHAVMQDVDCAVQTLQQLKTLGVSLAIDDFGTGYSCLAQLKHLPVDVLKIDQTFVAGLAEDGGDRAIVDATIRLARSFGLEVVAEGIETHDLVDQLLLLGCHRAQGYLLSRPKPPADLEEIIARGGIDPGILARPSPPAAPARPAGRRRRESVLTSTIHR